MLADFHITRLSSVGWTQHFLLAFLVFNCASSASSQRIDPPLYLTHEQKLDLMLYAKATWKSMVSLTYPNGLTSDHMDNENDRPASYTTVTNIACYMWSVIVARNLDLISNYEAVERLRTTLQTLEKLEKYHGHFLNYYNAKTGESDTVKEISSVDSGWLAAGFILVKNAVPEVRAQAASMLNGMNFSDFYHEPDGCLKRTIYPVEEKSSGTYCTLNTETRIAMYIGIGRKQIPKKTYFVFERTPEEDCRGSWGEMKPRGFTKTYMGIKVFEGHYKYYNYNIVPSWGGSMFEALMVPLIVPETTWGRDSWAINHALYVKAQIKHGLEEAKYGYWGFSPCYNPSGGYREYGVDAIGINQDGYYSNNNNTGVDYGFPGCGRDPKPFPAASEYINGVVTPHAIFLGLAFEPKAATDLLRKLRKNFCIFGKYGFYDSVNVQTGEVAKNHVSLDQGMIMAAIGNALANNCLQRYFTDEPGIEKILKPLFSMERFSSGISSKNWNRRRKFFEDICSKKYSTTKRS